MVVGERPDQDTKVLGHESKFHGGQTGEVISDGSPEVFESGIPKRGENRVGKVEFETRHSGEFGEISNDSREVCDAFKDHPNIISKGTKHKRGMGAGKSANEDVNCNSKEEWRERAALPDPARGHKTRCDCGSEADSLKIVVVELYIGMKGT